MQRGMLNGRIEKERIRYEIYSSKYHYSNEKHHKISEIQIINTAIVIVEKFVLPKCIMGTNNRI